MACIDTQPYTKECTANHAAKVEVPRRFPGITISRETLRLAVPGIPPQPAGRAPFIPPAGEKYIADLVRAQRELKWPVFKEDCIAMAQAMVENTDIQDKFKDHTVSKWWYDRWLRDYGLAEANQRPLEMARAKWFTASNVLKHYDICEQEFLEAGVAQPNPEFNPTEPLSEKIKIIKPERIFSFDETRIQMDMADAKFKSKTLKIVVDKRSTTGAHDKGNPNRDVVVSKGGGDASGVGGSTAAGDALPAMFIVAGESLDVDWMETEILSTILDNEGKPLSATW